MKEFNSISVSNSKGFTLLEILIAIVLLAFIVLAVVNITDNAFQTKDRTTEVNKNNLQIETAMSRFEWDFAQIYSPLYFSTVMNPNQNMNNMGNTTGNPGGAQGGDQSTQGAQGGFSPYLQQYYEQLVQRFERNEHFQSVSKEGLPVPRFYSPEKNMFEFFTTSNRRKLENTKQSHFAWVRYALADQNSAPAETNPEVKIPPNLKNLVRYYTPDDPYSDRRINIDDAERVKGAVLLQNVESLEFQFWDLNRRKWETSLRAVQGGENILHGVRVIITWYDSQGVKRSSDRIFRTHWPLAVLQDQLNNKPQTAGAGGTGGTTGTNGQIQGGLNQGGFFGN